MGVRTRLLSALSPQQLGGLAAALLYGFMSVTMAFINKAVLQLFPYSNTLLTLQMCVTALILYMASRSKAVKMQPWSWHTARSLLPLVFLYNANVAFALGSLRALNVPMYVTLKRLTPMVVLLLSYGMGNGAPTPKVALATLVTVSGCVIAGVGDLSFDLKGYAMAFTSCLLQALYLIVVERSGAEASLNTNELLFYNSVLSAPFLILILLFTGEMATAASAAAYLTFGSSSGSGSTWAFLPQLVISLLMGSMLNFTLFLCTLVNSALTTTIVGVLKGVVTTVLGFFLLGGVKLAPLNLLGITMNTIGGVWYSLEKFKAKAPKLSKPLRKIKPDEEDPPLPLSINDGVDDRNLPS